MLRRTSIVLLTVIVVGACRDGIVDMDIDHRWVDGVITQVEDGEPKKVLIEELDEEGEPVVNGRRVWFSITGETILLRATDSGIEPARTHNVKLGRGASAVSHSDIRYVDPPEAVADSLILRYGNGE